MDHYVDNKVRVKQFSSTTSIHEESSDIRQVVFVFNYISVCHEANIPRPRLLSCVVIPTRKYFVAVQH